MAGNQTLLVLGGIVLFSYLILSFNNASIVQLNLSLENEAVISATAVGQSIIDEIQTRAFDENTVTNYVESAADLTTSLGHNSSETSANLYNDVDDFNGYTRTENLGRLGDFSVEVDVYYVNRTTLAASAVPTFSKKVDVTVTNIYLPQPITLSHVISY